MMESLTNDIYDEALKLITEVSKAEHTVTYITERQGALSIGKTGITSIVLVTC